MNLKTTTSTSFTLLMSMMGASLLSCAFIVFRTGLILGIVLYLFSIIVVIFLIKFFLEAVYYTGAPTYRMLAEVIMGKKFSMVLDIAIDIQYYGFVTAYIIIASRAVQTFILNIFKYDANSLIIKAILSIVIIFPLCIPKSLNILSKIAGIAGLAIFITAFSILVYFFMFLKDKTVCTYTNNDVETSIKYGISLFPDVSPGQIVLIFLQYIPSFISNFGVHNIVPNLLKELQGPPQIKKKVLWVSLMAAIISAFILYAIVGFLGYYMFGKDLKDNVLQSFAPCKMIWIDILSILYAFVVIIAYPLVLFPIKVSLVGMTKYPFESKQGQIIAISISVLYVLASMGLAMAYESIVTIFGLFAALTSFFYIFLMPFVAYLQFPVLKAKNHDKDLINPNIETMTVDPVSVAILSMFAPTINAETIQRARALSSKFFGKAEVITNETDAGRKHAFSILRPRTFSVKTEDDGTIKLRTMSQARSSGGMLSEEAAAAAREVDAMDAETVEKEVEKVQEMHAIKEQGAIEYEDEVTIEEVEDTVKVENPVIPEIPLGRKIVAYGGIALFACICVEGIVVNLIDIIKAFS